MPLTELDREMKRTDLDERFRAAAERLASAVSAYRLAKRAKREAEDRMMTVAQAILEADADAADGL